QATISKSLLPAKSSFPDLLFETASTTGINNSRVTWIVSSSEELALRPLFRKNAFHCVPQDSSERPIYCDHSVTSADVRLKRRQYAAELLVVSANCMRTGVDNELESAKMEQNTDGTNDAQEAY